MRCRSRSRLLPRRMDLTWAPAYRAGGAGELASGDRRQQAPRARLPSSGAAAPHAHRRDARDRAVGARRTARPGGGGRKDRRQRLCLHPRPADAQSLGRRGARDGHRRLQHQDQLVRSDAGRSRRLLAGDGALAVPPMCRSPIAPAPATCSAAACSKARFRCAKRWPLLKPLLEDALGPQDRARTSNIAMVVMNRHGVDLAAVRRHHADLLRARRRHRRRPRHGFAGRQMARAQDNPAQGLDRLRQVLGQLRPGAYRARPPAMLPRTPM